MHVASAIIGLLLALPAGAEEPAASDEPHASRSPEAVQVAPAIGFAWLGATRDGRHANASGLALELHVDGRLAPRIGLGGTLSWGAPATGAAACCSSRSRAS